MPERAVTVAVTSARARMPTARCAEITAELADGVFRDRAQLLLGRAPASSPRDPRQPFSRGAASRPFAPQGRWGDCAIGRPAPAARGRRRGRTGACPRRSPSPTSRIERAESRDVWIRLFQRDRGTSHRRAAICAGRSATCARPRAADRPSRVRLCPRVSRRGASRACGACLNRATSRWRDDDDGGRRRRRRRRSRRRLRAEVPHARRRGASRSLADPAMLNDRRRRGSSTLAECRRAPAPPRDARDEADASAPTLVDNTVAGRGDRGRCSERATPALAVGDAAPPAAAGADAARTRAGARVAERLRRTRRARGAVGKIVGDAWQAQLDGLLDEDPELCCPLHAPAARRPRRRRRRLRLRRHRACCRRAGLHARRARRRHGGGVDAALRAGGGEGFAPAVRRRGDWRRERARALVAAARERGRAPTRTGSASVGSSGGGPPPRLTPSSPTDAPTWEGEADLRARPSAPAARGRPRPRRCAGWALDASPGATRRRCSPAWTDCARSCCRESSSTAVTTRGAAWIALCVRRVRGRVVRVLSVGGASDSTSHTACAATNTYVV